MMQAAGATIELSESTGALGANVPMAVVMDSVKFAGESSIFVHSCLYRRYGHSTYVPHDGTSTVMMLLESHCRRHSI